MLIRPHDRRADSQCRFIIRNQNSLLVKRQTDNTTPGGMGLAGFALGYIFLSPSLSPFEIFFRHFLEV